MSACEVKKTIFVLIALIMIASIATAATIDSFAITPSSGKKISDFSVTTLSTGGVSDITGICFSTSDNNASDKCTATSNPSAPISLAYTKISGLSSDTPSDATYNIYAYLQLSDGNYSNALSSQIIIDNTGPTILSTPSGGTDYNTTGVTIDFNAVDGVSGITQSSIVLTLDGTTQVTYSSLGLSTITNGYRGSYNATGLSVGDHSFTIDANDTLGNSTRLSTVSFSVDQTAPTSGAISFSGWTGSDKPTLTISATHSGGTSKVRMSFSCNNSSWSSWATYATSYADFNINNPAYGCSRTDWNKTIYARFSDIAGNIDSTTYRTQVLYDNVAPSVPEDLVTAPGSLSITLYWTALTDDNNSGNSKIEIYKNGSYLADVNWGETSYSATGLTNGTTYRFKIRSKDVAGNYSAFTSEISDSPQSTTATINIRKGGVITSYLKSGDVITVTCTYSVSSSGAKIRYKYFNIDSATAELTSSSVATGTLEGTFTMSSGTAGERIGFWCEASGYSGSNISYLTIDNTPPIASWKDTNNAVSGVRSFKINATDNKGIQRVEFEIDGKYFSGKSEIGTGNSYYFDLNSTSFENGAFTLKAKAFDVAGNETDIERSITISNSLTPTQQAAKAVSDARVVKNNAEQISTQYEIQGLLIPADILALKQSADVTLSEAEGLISTSTTQAIQKAQQASAKYSEFNSKAAIKISETKNFVYDSNNLSASLKKAGLSDAVAAKQSEVIKASAATRTLSIIGPTGAATAQVKITLTVKNDGNAGKIKIIEIIPKELVDSAKKVLSKTEMRIIKEDPIIEFTVDAAKGQTVTITYGIGEIAKSKADEIISTDVINKFIVPPLLFSGDEVPEDTMKQAAGSDQLTMAIIAVFVVIVLVIIGVFAVRFNDPGHGFGEKKSVAEHLTPEKEAEKRKFEANK